MAAVDILMHSARNAGGADSLDYDVNHLKIFVITILVISVCSLVLRFWSRLIAPDVPIGADDWLALAALPFTAGLAASTLVSISLGFGKHSDELSRDTGMRLLLCLYGGNLFFSISITISKISVLVFYGNLFGVRTYSSKAWRWAYYVVFGFTVAWLVTYFPYAIAQCRPVQKYWQSWLPGNCSNMYTFFISSAITSVGIDVAILTIPAFPMWKLELRLRRKLAIAAAILLGYGVAGMSIGRLIVTQEVESGFYGDEGYRLVPAMYWNNAEAALSTVAISLPAIFQLVKRFFQYGTWSLFNSKDYDLRDQYLDGERSEDNLGKNRWSEGAAMMPIMNTRV